VPSDSLTTTDRGELLHADAGARTDEPRPEIWFKRQVGLVPSLKELWRFRELVVTLAERDIRVRYKQAALGVAWALITPLLLMLAFSLIFTKFAKVDSHGAPYPLFSYLGLLPWVFFSSSLSQGGLSLTTNVALLNKVYCPREVFPLAAVVVATVDAIMSTLVLFLLFPAEGYAPKLSHIYYFPLLLLILFAFTIGVTLLVSAVLVYLRDLRLVLPLVLQFGLFVTPVGYNPEVVAHSTPLLALYSAVNPLVPVIDGFRRVILFGEAPQTWPLVAGGAVSAIVFIAGFMLFKRLETGMADIA